MSLPVTCPTASPPGHLPCRPSPQGPPTVTGGPRVAPGGLVQGGILEAGGLGVPATGSPPSKKWMLPQQNH